MGLPPFSRAIERRMRVIGILLFPVAVFVLVSLLTHGENDYPNSSKSPEEVYNLGGLLGAQVSSSLMVFLGYGGYFLPIFIGLLAWNRMRAECLGKLLVVYVWLLGLMAVGVATGSLIPIFPDSVRFQIGGVLGFYLGKQMEDALGLHISLALGTIVFLAVLVIIGYQIRRNLVQRPNLT